VLGLARMLSLASVAACLIVAASFVAFAVDRTSSASAHQQQELSGSPARTASAPATGAAAASASGTATASPSEGASSRESESGARKAMDDVADQITAPFAGVISSGSEWVTRGVKLLLTLAVYGFGVGYVARVIRVRA
jgi:hypothetical protein